MHFSSYTMHANENWQTDSTAKVFMKTITRFTFGHC